MERFRYISTAYTCEAESRLSRFIFGTSKTLPNLTLPEIGVRNSTKLPRLPGTITYSTSSLPRVVLGILSCGIYGASERSPVLCMEEVLEHLVEPQATLLADWLLVVGEV